MIPEIALLGAAAALAIRGLASPDRWYLTHKRTDWDAVRRRLGYDAEQPPEAAPGPLVAPLTRRERFVREFGPEVDWDRERVRLGYEPTREPMDFTSLFEASAPIPVPQGGIMHTIHRILIRLATAWLVIVGGGALLIALAGSGFDRDDWTIAAVIAGAPPLLAAVLAWIVKPAQ